MTSRQTTLLRGKTGTVQRFSRARVFSNETHRLILSTLADDINDSLRDQILSDPALVLQYACVWGDSIGYLTRPFIVQPDVGDTRVLGSFTDTIGQCYPISISLDAFKGSFSTLTTQGDIEALNLPVHPDAPDTVDGPPPRGEARVAAGNQARLVEASMARLGFTLPDEPTDADRPRITAYPIFLALEPGMSFAHSLRLDAPMPAEVLPAERLFHSWRAGYNYCKTHNGGHSVTKGGPLFHLPSLLVGDDQSPPFETLDIRDTLPGNPTILSPLHDNFQLVHTRLAESSDYIWLELGGNLPPELPPAAPAAGGFTPDSFRLAVEPLIKKKEKTYRLGPRTAAKLRTLLASRPLPGAPDQDNAVLPVLKQPLLDYLNEHNNATAADDFKELVRNRVAACNASTTCYDKDATFEPEMVTLAYSDRFRAFFWLMERIHATSKVSAHSTLGLMQHLTPDRSALAIISEGDSQVKSMILANATHSQTQIDASKSSKMYCGGRLVTFRDAYVLICNLRVPFSLVVDDLSLPMSFQRLMSYTDLLVDRDGRLFGDAHSAHPHLAVHIFQDLQLIWTAFCNVAANADLYQAVQKDDPIALSNYSTAHAVADGVTADLRAILNGNGLGKFQGIPCCVAWFSGNSTATPGATHGRNSDADRVSRTPSASQDAGASSKRRRLDPAEIERKKALGILMFDSRAAGTNRLPTLTVYHKARGSRVSERVCMPFLTRGFCCPKMEKGDTCSLPHLSNAEVLSAAERTKMVNQVRSKTGLSWVEGKAPSGTT